MAFKIERDPDDGAKVEGPPLKWRPRDLKDREKFEIIIRQRGYEPDGKTRLLPMQTGVDFDHQPAIQERRWDPEEEDTIPRSCDLDFIVALNKPTHAAKTAKRDIKEIAKTRRLEKGPKKSKTKWGSRPFPKKVK